MAHDRANVACRNGQLWLAAMWWAADCTSYWAVFRFRIWTEHHGTDDTNRTHFNWLERFQFAPNGIGYHYEHHLWPSIPGWNLPKARSLMDRNVPIIPMRELLRSFAACAPRPSGWPRTRTFNIVLRLMRMKKRLGQAMPQRIVRD
jgi:fatty acid desaturase